MKKLNLVDSLFIFLVFLILLCGFFIPNILKVQQPFSNLNLIINKIRDLTVNENKLNQFNTNQKYLSSDQLNDKTIVSNWSDIILNNAKNNLPIARMYFPYIPKHIEEYEINKKKDVFISIMLPIALRGNELALEDRKLAKMAFSTNNIYQIEFLSKKYKVRNFKKINFSRLTSSEFARIKSELLIKIDTIPISMILAQAIIESGWGSSRFAQEGNALFGEWTWKNNQGIKPRGNVNADFAVKNFKNVLESLNSYILNLNRHSAYGEMREYRELQNKKNKIISGYEMANFLENYAEIGFEYVKKVTNMINSNKLYRFRNSKLENN